MDSRPKISHVRYGNKVLKKIFAKQILNKEHREEIHQKDQIIRINQQYQSTEGDPELAGASLYTDDSLSKL